MKINKLYSLALVCGILVSTINPVYSQTLTRLVEEKFGNWSVVGGTAGRNMVFCQARWSLAQRSVMFSALVMREPLNPNPVPIISTSIMIDSIEPGRYRLSLRFSGGSSFTLQGFSDAVGESPVFSIPDQHRNGMIYAMRRDQLAEFTLQKPNGRRERFIIPGADRAQAFELRDDCIQLSMTRLRISR